MIDHFFVKGFYNDQTKIPKRQDKLRQYKRKDKINKDKDKTKTKAKINTRPTQRLKYVFVIDPFLSKDSKKARQDKTK